jgi:serine/threonine protein phosphatase PrpC
MSATDPVSEPSPIPRLVAAGQTHPGRQRPLNEDAWQIASEADTGHLWAARGQLFAVADGMGGHAAGEVASQLALDTLLRQYYSSDETPVPPAIRLDRAVLEANLDIYEQAVSVDAQAGMGTTLVTAVVQEDRLIVANVGDSRAYLVRDGEAIQITDDHSWVAEQVKLGVMTDEQAENHAYRNVVTRCLGHKPGIQVDIFEHRLRDGDAILLCSDGLSNQVSADEMARVVAEHTPEESTDELIDLANRAGGPDNITAVVVQVVALSTAAAPPADEGGLGATETQTPTETGNAHDLAPRGLTAREVAARITPVRGIPIRLPEEERITPQRRRATLLLVLIALVAVTAIVVLIALRADKLTRQLGWPAPLPPAALPEPARTPLSAPSDVQAAAEGAPGAPTETIPPYSKDPGF